MKRAPALRSPPGAGRFTFTRSSRVAASADDVWAHATSMRELNREFVPWLKMTYPPAARGLSLGDAQIELGQPLFTSWILLLGFLPVERMRVTLVEVGPGRRFVEQSAVLFLKFWRHERSVTEGEDGGCILTDTLTCEPRAPAFAPFLNVLVRLLFLHRHRMLERIFRLRLG